MIKTILVVLDGQSPQHASIDLALQWSTEFDALLVGFGVIDEAAVHPPEAVPVGAGLAKAELDAARLHEQQQAIERCLSAVALRCANEHVAFKPLERMGQPAEEIAIEAQRFDLIVMRRFANDESETTQQNLSKPLSTILHATPRPVVAVSKELPQDDAVVVAFDGSLQAARTLQLFAASGLAAKRPIHVVSVDDDHVEAARRGDRALEFLAHHDVHGTLHAKTRTANPSQHIMELASELNAGLLVMGAYGQPRIREFILGSVTRTVLEECSTPIFLYH